MHNIKLLLKSSTLQGQKLTKLDSMKQKMTSTARLKKTNHFKWHKEIKNYCIYFNIVYIYKNNLNVTLYLEVHFCRYSKKLLKTCKEN